MFPDVIVPIPPGLKFFKESAGGWVEISNHTWERFCVRYPRAVGQPLSPNRPVRTTAILVNNLRLIFSRASEETLNERVAFDRLVRNGCKEVLYFLDGKTRLRFVVSRDDPKTILTVESAYDSKTLFRRG